jgi:radical SAM protein with 4Fe4S-binding SPASM domain
MTLDISHLLLADTAGCGCSAAGCGAPADRESRQRPDPYTQLAADAPADMQDSAGMLYWNLFAYPVKVGSRRYAFLTDVRSVLAVDEATFVTLGDARGGPVPDGIAPDRAGRLLELGLVRREPARRQFEAVFSPRMQATRENQLLHLITSYTCNLTCSYCFMLADLGKHGRKLLSFEDAKKGIDLYFRSSYAPDSVMHFYGGEPLLHPQLIDDSLTYIHQRYCDTVIPKIITNGTLHSPRVLDLLRKYDFDLSVSMDGDKQAHDVFRVDHRGRSTFAKTVAGIRAFQEIGYEPKVLITVGEHNIRRLPEVVSFVLSLRPHAIALNFPRELPEADTGLDGEAGDATFWVEQYERCLELCFEQHIPELYFADMLFAYLSGEPVLSPCAACGSQVSVGPGAQVGPCQAFVAAGMFSQPAEQYRQQDAGGPFAPWQNVSKATSRKCSSCPISAICGGDCSFDRYNRTGSLLEPLPFHCDLRLRMADHLVRRLVAGQPVGFAATS